MGFDDDANGEQEERDLTGHTTRPVEKPYVTIRKGKFHRWNTVKRLFG